MIHVCASVSSVFVFTVSLDETFVFFVWVIGVFPSAG